MRLGNRLTRNLWASCVLALCGSASGAADPASPTRVHVSLPSGGCSLMLHQDGRGGLGYGALPRRVDVAPGRFEFAEVLAGLRQRAETHREAATGGDSMATVNFGDDSRVQYIADGEFVRALLQHAWRHQVAALTTRQQEDREIIGSACGFLPAG